MRLSRLRRLMRTGKNSQLRALARAPPTKTPPCATPTTASGLNVLEIDRARARTKRSKSAQLSSRTFPMLLERSCGPARGAYAFDDSSDSEGIEVVALRVSLELCFAFFFTSVAVNRVGVRRRRPRRREVPSAIRRQGDVLVLLDLNPIPQLTGDRAVRLIQSFAVIGEEAPADLIAEAQSHFAKPVGVRQRLSR